MVHGLDMQTEAPYLLGTVVCGVLICISGCGLWCLWNGMRSRKWPTTKGVMLHSDIEGSEDSDGTGSYRIRARYRYEVGGQEFIGKRVFFGQAILWTSAFDRLLRKTSRYHPGSEVKVHFHCKKPSRCVLQPGMNVEPWIVTVLGLGLLGWFLFLVR
jgi:Protein of unknown function (DUF3592)